MLFTGTILIGLCATFAYIIDFPSSFIFMIFFFKGFPSATSPLQIPGPSSPFGPSSLTSVGDSLFAHHKISNDSAVSIGDYVGSASSLSLFQGFFLSTRRKIFIALGHDFAFLGFASILVICFCFALSCRLIRVV